MFLYCHLCVDSIFLFFIVSSATRTAQKSILPPLGQDDKENTSPPKAGAKGKPVFVSSGLGPTEQVPPQTCFFLFQVSSVETHPMLPPTDHGEKVCQEDWSACGFPCDIRSDACRHAHRYVSPKLVIAGSSYWIFLKPSFSFLFPLCSTRALAANYPLW